MSWKFADLKLLSLRGRYILSSLLTTGGLLFSTAVIVTFVAYAYLIGDVNDKMARIADDLQEEYREFGGLTAEFKRCVDDDAEEHNVNTTFILVTDGNKALRYATPTPLGFQKRLLHELSKNRLAGRFYTERDADDVGRHGAVRFVMRPLTDDGWIILAYEVSDIETFLIFLASTLGGVSVVGTLLAGVFSFLIAGRILKLNQIVAEKEAAYAELRHLTDDIAHDLRTPLTRLSMAAETEMSGGSLRESLAVQVHGETHSMLELINTMLEISQTDAKIDRTPRETIDLAAFARRIRDLYAPVIEDSGLQFEMKLSDSAIPFSGHRGKLQQLFGNLIDNAIKFTPRGGKIVVSLSSGDAEISLSVADTGCGIASADIPLVFRRFWRADSSRHCPGNGLGLALVHAIVTSYGGKIYCSSELGRGTVFSVILPSELIMV